MTAKDVHYYVLQSGKSPFLEWMNGLDLQKQVIVDRYIQRVAQGGAKKSIKNLKDGVFEVKIFYGGGLRIYFAEEKNTIVLLLIGGDKKTQVKDIKKAKKYWREYGKQK